MKPCFLTKYFNRWLIVASTLLLFAFSDDHPKVSHTDKPLFNYYTKQLNCDGIWIRSGEVVDDRALQVAYHKIKMMLAAMPDARYNMAQKGAELHIIGKDQQTSDLPEFADMKGVTYKDNTGIMTNIDSRTRGMGGLHTSCGEENLLNLPGDRYGGGQDICIHEFSHNIMGAGLDDVLRQRIRRQYEQAMAKELWKGAYAAVNENEYWGELSMWYFGAHGAWVNRRDHFPAAGPDGLKAYDEGGYLLLDSIYTGKLKPARLTIRTAKKVSLQTQPKQSDERATLLILNDTGQKINLSWLGVADSNVRSRRQLAPFKVSPVRTFKSRICVVKDMQGNLLGCYQITDAYNKVTVSLK